LPDGNPPPPPSGSIGTCKEYLAANPGAPSGKYMLDLDGPNGTTYPPISIYCDMTFAGGGWTLIQSFDDSGSSAQNFGAKDDAGYYLASPPEPGKIGGLAGWVVKGLAERSSQLHIRMSFQSDAGADGGIWITSKEPDAGQSTRVMFNLKNLDVTTKGTDGGFEEWTGPQATAGKLAWLPLYGGGPGTCGIPVEELKYPSIYWACGNFVSMNLMHPQGLARWTYQPSTGNDPMEVYVR